MYYFLFMMLIKPTVSVKIDPQYTNYVGFLGVVTVLTIYFLYNVEFNKHVCCLFILLCFLSAMVYYTMPEKD